MNQFKNLLVWKKGMDLVVEIYAHTEKFPDKEKFGLTNQINRCAVSIVSNIAEGAGRNSEKEFNNFLGISLGSTCELETQILIASRLKYIEEDTVNKIIKSIEEIQKMLVGLQKSIKLSIQTN
jgi:four helix bundle protein